MSYEISFFIVRISTKFHGASHLLSAIEFPEKCDLKPMATAMHFLRKVIHAQLYISGSLEKQNLTLTELLCANVGNDGIRCDSFQFKNKSAISDTISFCVSFVSV